MDVDYMAQQVSHRPGQSGPSPGQQQREQPTIWQGIVEWLQKGKNPNEPQERQQKQIPCQVSVNSKDGEPELKADAWPSKLIMQLIPKQLIGSIDGAYLENSKTVLFHPTPCEALDSLTKVMSTGFAGCVHFTSPPTAPSCDIKVLILLYILERGAYLGFIPNNQTVFVDSLRIVIQHQKSLQIMRRNKGTFGPASYGPGPLLPAFGHQGQLYMQGGMPQQQVNLQAGGMVGQQRPPCDELASKQNLMKLQQLRQTLEAARQLDAQYKSQLEVNIQQNLEVAQQGELKCKQEPEQRAGGMMSQPWPPFDDLELARQQSLMKFHQLRRNMEQHYDPQHIALYRDQLEVIIQQNDKLGQEYKQHLEVIDLMQNRLNTMKTERI